ncbi:MAG: SPOR domain-containing protein [Candidatus Cloacimonetes bacterium]|nr:SPOR domain-containing protein [Candidatus Cloacimonadota bacterium]
MIQYYKMVAKTVSVLLLLVFSTTLSAQNLIGKLEKTYSSGNLSSLARLLDTSVGTTSEEIAAVKFFRARMQISQKAAFDMYSSLITRHPGTLYAQKAYLEKGQMHILKREYVAAAMNFEKIDARLPERNYYLTKTYFKSGRFTKAITTANAFLAVGKDFRRIEYTYFTLAETHLTLTQYDQALAILLKLRDSDYLENAALLFYKIGYCYEKKEQFPEAVAAYKKVLVDFPVSMYSFQAEDRLYGLEQKGTVNVTELSTYTNGTGSKDPPTRPAPAQTQSNPMLTPSEPVQSAGEAGLYLQVGAFGSESNANKTQARMKSMNYPCVIFTINSSGKAIHKVAIGPFTDSDKARITGRELDVAGIKYIIIIR